MLFWHCSRVVGTVTETDPVGKCQSNKPGDSVGVVTLNCGSQLLDYRPTKLNFVAARKRFANDFGVEDMIARLSQIRIPCGWRVEQTTWDTRRPLVRPKRKTNRPHSLTESRRVRKEIQLSAYSDSWGEQRPIECGPWMDQALSKRNLGCMTFHETMAGHAG